MLSCTPGKERQRWVEHENRCTNGDRHCNDSSEQRFSDERLVPENFMHSVSILGMRSFGRHVDVPIPNQGRDRIMR